MAGIRATLRREGSEGRVLGAAGLSVWCSSGSCSWPAAQWYPVPRGSVTLGPYLRGPQGEREVELPRVTLPSAPAPGESTTVELRIPRDTVRGRDTIALDLVREGVCWFGDIGSEPLVLPVPA